MRASTISELADVTGMDIRIWMGGGDAATWHRICIHLLTTSSLLSSLDLRRRRKRQGRRSGLGGGCTSRAGETRETVSKG